MSKLTPANLLSTAADLLDKYGMASGTFVVYGGGAMCVHGALNQAQAILKGLASIDDLPSAQYAVGFNRQIGTPMAAAIDALVDLGAQTDAKLVGKESEPSISPWVAIWANRLVDDGKGAEVIAKLREAAEKVTVSEAVVAFLPKTAAEVRHA